MGCDRSGSDRRRIHARRHRTIAECRTAVRGQGTGADCDGAGSDCTGANGNGVRAGVMLFCPIAMAPTCVACALSPIATDGAPLAAAPLPKAELFAPCHRHGCGAHHCLYPDCSVTYQIYCNRSTGLQWDCSFWGLSDDHPSHAALGQSRAFAPWLATGRHGRGLRPSKSTIGAFEAKGEDAKLTTMNNRALVEAFERAGILFIPENGGGVGLRLQARTSAE